MWNQGKDSTLVEQGLVLNADENMLAPKRISFPQLPLFATGGGFSVELWLTVEEMEAGLQLLSTVGPKEKGIEISLAEGNAIKIKIRDGIIRDRNISENTEFISDENTLQEGKLHHVV